MAETVPLCARCCIRPSTALLSLLQSSLPRNVASAFPYGSPQRLTSESESRLVFGLSSNTKTMQGGHGRPTEVNLKQH